MTKLTATMAAILLTASSATLAKTDTALNSGVVEIEHLILVENSKMDQVFLAPDNGIQQYDKVLIADVVVEFKKNYMRDYNRKSTMRLTKNDMDRMTTKIATAFTKVFTEVMEKNGIEVVDHLEDDVLIIRPALRELYVETPSTSYTGYAKSWGRNSMAATIYAEVYGNGSGDRTIQAVVIDRQQAPESIFLSRQSQSRNQFDGGSIMQRWAQNFADAINGTSVKA